jgi:hypothetical protein
MVDNSRTGSSDGEAGNAAVDNSAADNAAADNAALRWDGETDTSHVDGPAAARAREKADSRVTTKAAAREARAQASANGALPDGAAGGKPEKPEISSFLLVTYGILAGMYGLYVIGWVVAINRTAIVLSDPLGQLMFQFGQGLAIGSAPLWFAAVFVLTRKNKTITRLVWLLLGLLLVAPWPAILGGA